MINKLMYQAPANIIFELHDMIASLFVLLIPLMLVFALINLIMFFVFKDKLIIKNERKIKLESNNNIQELEKIRDKNYHFIVKIDDLNDKTKEKIDE